MATDTGLITPYTALTRADAVQQLREANTALTALKINGPLDDGGARAVVEAAARNGTLRTLRALDLGWKGLTVLSDDLVRLTDLQEPMVKYNQLTRLPVGVSRLGCLRVLDLYNNRLQTLPDEIGQLTGLMQLNLRYNQLTTLPATCTKLTSLVDLHLDSK